MNGKLTNQDHLGNIREVVDASDTILWLVGRRTDHRFRITDVTTAILRLSFC